MAQTRLKPIEYPIPKSMEKVLKKGVEWGLLVDKKSDCEEQGGVWAKGKCSLAAAKGSRIRKGKKKYLRKISKGNKTYFRGRNIGKH